MLGIATVGDKACLVSTRDSCLEMEARKSMHTLQTADCRLPTADCQLIPRKSSNETSSNEATRKSKSTKSRRRSSSRRRRCSRSNAGSP